MLIQETYNTVVGMNSITLPALAFVTLKKVKREGLGFDIILTGTPTTRQVLHTVSSGTLEFADVFNDSEKLYVLYNS